MMKSPIKKHGDQYREEARRLSEKSGTPGDYNRDDPKVNIELDKADKADAEHKDSPLEGAYTSGAGGQAYVSNRQDFQQLQDRIAGAAISIMAGENDPQTQLERADKLAKKAQAAQDLLKQRAKNKRSTEKLTAAEKTEITKQHYLSEGDGTEDDWNALTPKAKKEMVLDYRTYYGFN